MTKREIHPVPKGVTKVTTPRERIAKGSDLEKAVELIEGAILSASPTLKGNAFAIQRRKIIVVDGVTHEIDVWVDIDSGKGYKSVFIFECKNWQDKVGKNEIIIFSEKIKAARAHRGFFVAMSFTTDAEAQCKLDPLMELLKAREASTVFSHVPVNVIIHNVTRRHLDLVMDLRGGSPKGDDPSCVYRNEVTTLRKCRDQWVNEIVHEALKPILQEVDQAITAAQEGPRVRNEQKVLTFQPGELVIEGKNVSQCRLDVEIQIDFTPTRLIFQYEVETRGWSVSWEPVKRTTPVVPGVEIGDIGFATSAPLPAKSDMPAA
jgi:hypothetical protein